MDRAAGDLEVLRFLVTQKEKYPNQVTLILGNRDLNKMPLLDIAREFERDKDIKAATRDVKAHLDGFNARQAYEFRRAFLSQGGIPATDEIVTRSFLNEIEKGGLARRYIELGEIAKVIDNTLFTHGMFTDKNAGRVPGVEKPVGDIREALRLVNRWAETQKQDWAAGRGGRALLEYQFASETSLVNSQNFDTHHNLLPTPDALVEKLRRQGITRIVSGHTPQGSTPMIARQGGFEVVVGDNSYSPGNKGSLIQFRGDETLLAGELPDGRKVFSFSKIGDRTPVGKLTPDGHRIIGQLENGEYLMFKYMPGYAPSFRQVGEGALPRNFARGSATCSSRYARLVSAGITTSGR